MMQFTKHKENVANPLLMLNTIGEEVCCLFSNYGYENAEVLLKIPNLAKKERLSQIQIRKICAMLNGGDSMYAFLDTFQNNYLQEKQKGLISYKQSKKNFTRLKMVLPLLRNEYNDGLDRLDDILDYFNVLSEQDIFVAAEKTAALFRQQNNVDVDPVNLKAWLRRGELDFERMNLPEYDKEELSRWIDSRQWEAYLEDESYLKSLPNILSRFGVALVLVPFLPKTVYGAVRWFDGHPLIQISDRGQDLATCWFTLFHEFGHILLHEKADIFEGSMNDSKVSKIQREREANKFANHYLFNGDDLRKEIFASVQKGECIVPSSLAKKYNVNLIFVAYWLIKAQYQPTFQKRIHIDFTSVYQS